MTERPILFSAPMVRALLAGVKTQTRRVVKLLPADLDTLLNKVKNVDVCCPHEKPGDRLWVRETWHYRYSSSTLGANQFMHGVRYRADGACREVGPMPLDGVGLPKQRERNPDESWQEREDYLCAYWRRWRPSIYMPRWASRITLEITGIRVERLQNISVSDALAEGITHRTMNDPRVEYQHLWEDINGAGSWDANPWVWVVVFKRLDGDAA